MTAFSPTSHGAIDLVALADDPLVRDSYPYACLSVRGIGKHHQAPDDVLTRYALRAEQGPNATTMHLLTVQRREEEHKLQAVRLFVAGLELIARDLVTQALLFEVSQLHVQLALACGQNPLRHLPDGKSLDWPLVAGAFDLAAPIDLHLRQAGFPLEIAASRLRLERTDVHAMVQDLVHEAAIHGGISCSKY